MEPQSILTPLVVCVVAIGLALLVAFGVWIVVLVRIVERTSFQQAQQDFPNALHIEKIANFFGQESLGPAQKRGNGTLILSDSELVFHQWWVNKEFRIPYRAITAIEHPTSFLGKTRFTPLLKVAYTNEQGVTDSMAWWVSDPYELKRLIKNQHRAIL